MESRVTATWRAHSTRACAVALATLAIAGLVACSGDGSSSASPTTLPPQVAAMWSATGQWLAVAPPKATYVPGPDTPSSARLTALVRRANPGSDHDARAVPGPRDAAETLYADPTSAEPWADRAVMVGRVAGSDVEGMFAPRNGTVAATIQGKKGRVGHDGKVWFASWPIPTCDVCDQEAFVIGHGLTKARVLAIAETVSQKPAPHAKAATLPDGLKSLGSAPIAQGTVSVGVQPQELAMTAGNATATFQVWSGDPRLYAHLAFWSLNGKPIESWRPGWADVVQHGKVTVTIAGTPDSPEPSPAEQDALRRAAAALVPGDAAAVKAAVADAVKNLKPLPADRNLCAGSGLTSNNWATLSGVVGKLRWGLTLEAGKGFINSCDGFWFATSGAVPGGDGGGPLEPVPPGGVRFANVGTTGSGGDEPWIRTVAGDVPDSAVRVVVTVDGKPTEAKLSDVGPEPARRWFATAVPSDQMNMAGKVDVVAYDQAGNQVAAGTGG